MSSNPKARKRSSVAQKLVEAAAYDLRHAHGDDSGGIYKRAAVRLREEAQAKLSETENQGIGVGGEMMLHPAMTDDPEARRLLDTVQDPTYVTACAELERLRLAEMAGSFESALDVSDTIRPENSLEKMLAHQMAAIHTLSMRMTGKANDWLYHGSLGEYGDPHKAQIGNLEATRAANAAAKLMQTFQQGLLTIQRLRSGGKQQVTVVHQHVQVAGGQVAVAGTVQPGGGSKGGDSEK